MSEPTEPTDQPAQPAPPPNTYRVYLLSGTWFDVVTHQEFVAFIQGVRATGFVLTEVGYTPHDSILTIQRNGQPAIGGNVVQLHRTP